MDCIAPLTDIVVISGKDGNVEIRNTQTLECKGLIKVCDRNVKISSLSFSKDKLLLFIGLETGEVRVILDFESRG